jgi:hypothetical protein
MECSQVEFLDNFPVDQNYILPTWEAAQINDLLKWLEVLSADLVWIDETVDLDVDVTCAVRLPKGICELVTGCW